MHDVTSNNPKSSFTAKHPKSQQELGNRLRSQALHHQKEHRSHRRSDVKFSERSNGQAWHLPIVT